MMGGGACAVLVEERTQGGEIRSAWRNAPKGEAPKKERSDQRGGMHPRERHPRWRDPISVEECTQGRGIQGGEIRSAWRNAPKGEASKVERDPISMEECTQGRGIRSARTAQAPHTTSSTPRWRESDQHGECTQGRGIRSARTAQAPPHHVIHTPVPTDHGGWRLR